MQQATYEKTTHGIRVVAMPIYLEDQSAPDENHYVWAYNITLENHSSQVVQLESRYWQITDGHGRIQEVRGPGVVGEQPVLSPSERFEYQSGVPLSTPSGFMVGTYTFVMKNGDRVEVDIPAFSLDSPYTPKNLH